MRSRKGLRRTRRELRYMNRIMRAKKVWRWHGEEPRHWDRDGRPIDLHTWAKAFEDDAYRHVKATRFGTGERACMVSTIWRGVDFGFGATRAPGIYQTLLRIGDAPVLSGAHEILHGQEWLSTFEREALITHRAVAHWFEPVYAALNGRLIRAWGERGMRSAATIAEAIHEIAEARRAIERVGE